MIVLARGVLVAVGLGTMSIAAAGRPAFAVELPATCPMKAVATLPLFPTHQRMLVGVRINGFPLNMTLDTGWSRTAITKVTKNALHLADSTTRTVEAGVLGTKTTTDAMVTSFEVGPVAFPMTAISVTGGIEKDWGDGYLGTDFLSRYDVEFDMPGKKLTLYEPTGCAPVVDVRTANMLPPAANFDGQHMMLVRFNIENHGLLALVDTGATGLFLTRKAAIEKLGRTERDIEAAPSAEGTAIGDNPMSGHSLHVDRIAIGDVATTDVTLSELDSKRDDFDIVLGMQFLRFQRFWVSYRTQRVVPIEVVGLSRDALNAY